MKRLFLVVSISFLYLVSAFAQEVQLTVADKPLNMVLGMLGVEISFDDQALSVYKVSVSETFESPEEALSYLLSDKPFCVEKVNDVYVIVPAGVKTSGSSTKTESKENTGELTLAGILSGADSKERPDGITLPEIIIMGEKIRYKVDRISYQVTPDMRRGVTNVEELLGEIPGVYFDKVTNSLQVNNSKDVLLLVDGIQQSADYIRNLSPDRIRSVEIINESSGRFVSDGYMAIVNLILDKDYRGYEVYASSFSAFKTSDTSGDDWLALNQPEISAVYTQDKINVYGTYSYNKENQNLPVSKELIYRGTELLSDIQKNKPNDFYMRETHTVAGGLNYQITPTHILGIQGDYVSGKTRTHQIYTMQRTDIINNKRQVKNTTRNQMSDDTYVGTLFYQGQINNRFWLYGDFSYNYYNNDIDNLYDQNDFQNYKDENRYNEYKHQTLLNVDSRYMLSPEVSINLGYSNVWRKYGSESSHGRGFLDYREYRNKAFAYLMVSPSEKIHAKAGTAVEYITSYNREHKNSYVRILPYLQANINIDENVNLNVSYSTNQYYPLLYQLSPMSIVVDTFLTQTGNPELKSAVRHTASARISLWDKLTLTPAFSYIHDYTSELYEEKGYKLYRSFDNINMREYSLQITYDQPIGNNFRFKNMATWYSGEALGAEIKIRPSGWLINSELSYYHPGKSFGVRLGYHRNMMKRTLSQGYQMIDKDNWLVSVNKNFWNKRVSVALSYIPPVSWGIRYDQLRMLETSLYKEKTNRYLKSYNNMILLKVSFRWDRGNSKSVKRRTAIRSEREKKTIDL